MGGHVEMKNLSASMSDCKPHIEQLEVDRRYDEKIHRGDHVSMISQECNPALLLIMSGFPLREIPGNGREADADTQLLELGLNPACPPRILGCEPRDERLQFKRDPRPSRAPL
jgi:hypothetical protein